MIGEIEFEHAGKLTRARLDDDLSWHCEQPELQQLLNQACPVSRYQPEFGRPGLHELYQAGHRLNARCICLQDLQVALEPAAC